MVWFIPMTDPVNIPERIRNERGMTDEKNAFGRFLLTAGRIIPGAIALLSLVNIFHPILFTVDADCVYRALPVRYGILGVQILLMLLLSAYAASLMKRKDARQRHALRDAARLALL